MLTSKMKLVCNRCLYNAYLIVDGLNENIENLIGF